MIKSIFAHKAMGTVVHIGQKFYTYTYNTKGKTIYRLKYSDYNADGSIVKKLKDDGFCSLYDYESGKELLITHENILKQSSYKHADHVVLSFFVDKKDVSEFFQYRIFLQLKGKIIKEFYPLTYGQEIIDKQIVTFNTFDGNISHEYGKYGHFADELFGPRHECKNLFMSDFGRYRWEYRVPIKETEKILMVKEFIDVENIGTEREHQKNGKKERIELDMQYPDMSIYSYINSVENCVEIEW